MIYIESDREVKSLNELILYAMNLGMSNLTVKLYDENDNLIEFVAVEEIIFYPTGEMPLLHDKDGYLDKYGQWLVRNGTICQSENSIVVSIYKDPTTEVANEELKALKKEFSDILAEFSRRQFLLNSQSEKLLTVSRKIIDELLSQ